jgi:hypothetical protein
MMFEEGSGGSDEKHGCSDDKWMKQTEALANLA